MALISRFTRLFRADLHAVLDRIEEPEILLRQSVREMEENLSSDQRTLKILENELENIPPLLAEHADMFDALQEEIGLCLDSDNDQLAKSKIRRKLELQQREKRLHARQESLLKEVTTLRERIVTNQHRLDSMRQKLDLFAKEQNKLAKGGPENFHESEISEDDIEVALMREKKLYKGHAHKSGTGVKS